MAGKTETDVKEAGKGIAWNPELEKRLILTLMTDHSPDLAVKGWKEVGEKMKPFGFTTMACKKQWGKIRKEYFASSGVETGTAPAGSKKRKTENAEDTDKPKKEARGKKTTPKKSTAAVVEDQHAEDMDDDEAANE